MKKIAIIMALICLTTALSAKTLIVYYSFTNNSHVIATDLKEQTGADILRIEPADENVDYNDYSIGLPMMNKIKARPDDPESYPAIKPVDVRLADYGTILIVAPLWWNNMAAPLQTYLFCHGHEMAGKNIGLIVSSGESSIEGVEADTRRLIPGGTALVPSLWILRSRTAACHELIAEWLREIHYDEVTAVGAVAADRAARISLSDGFVTVDGSFSSLTVYNAQGVAVLSTSSPKMSTEALPAGVYFTRLDDGETVTSCKVCLGKK